MERKLKRMLVGRLPLIVLSLLIVAGCAPYKLEPLTTAHPAHPEAAAVPEPPRSKTLAYTKADLPSSLPSHASSMDMKTEVMAEKHGSGAPTSSPPRTAVGEGSVVAVVPSSGQIVLEHGEIKGFMDAMTMGYRVETTSVLEGLKPGDQVRFTIDTGKQAIIKVEKLNR